MSITRGPWRDDKRTNDDNNGGNSAGGGGDGMEVRVARLESDVEYIKRDIAEIKQDAKDFRVEVRENFNLLRGDTDTLRGEMQSGFASIRGDLTTQMWAFIGIVAALISAGLWGFWHLSENAHESTSQIIEVKQELKSIGAALEEIKKAVTK